MWKKAPLVENVDRDISEAHPDDPWILPIRRGNRYAGCIAVTKSAREHKHDAVGNVEIGLSSSSLRGLLAGLGVLSTPLDLSPYPAINLRAAYFPTNPLYPPFRIAVESTRLGAATRTISQSHFFTLGIPHDAAKWEVEDRYSFYAFLFGEKMQRPEYAESAALARAQVEIAGVELFWRPSRSRYRAKIMLGLLNFEEPNDPAHNITRNYDELAVIERELQVDQIHGYRAEQGVHESVIQPSEILQSPSEPCPCRANDEDAATVEDEDYQEYEAFIRECFCPDCTNSSSSGGDSDGESAASDEGGEVLGEADGVRKSRNLVGLQKTTIHYMKSRSRTPEEPPELNPNRKRRMRKEEDEEEEQAEKEEVSHSSEQGRQQPITTDALQRVQPNVDAETEDSQPKRQCGRNYWESRRHPLCKQAKIPIKVPPIAATYSKIELDLISSAPLREISPSSLLSLTIASTLRKLERKLARPDRPAYPNDNTLSIASPSPRRTWTSSVLQGDSFSFESESSFRNESGFEIQPPITPPSSPSEPGQKDSEMDNKRPQSPFKVYADTCSPEPVKQQKTVTFHESTTLMSSSASASKQKTPVVIFRRRRSRRVVTDRSPRAKSTKKSRAENGGSASRDEE